MFLVSSSSSGWVWDVLFWFRQALTAYDSIAILLMWKNHWSNIWIIWTWCYIGLRALKILNLRIGGFVWFVITETNVSVLRSYVLHLSWANYALIIIRPLIWVHILTWRLSQIINFPWRWKLRSVSLSIFRIFFKSKWRIFTLRILNLIIIF